MDGGGDQRRITTSRGIVRGARGKTHLGLPPEGFGLALRRQHPSTAAGQGPVVIRGGVGLSESIDERGQEWHGRDEEERAAMASGGTRGSVELSEKRGAASRGRAGEREGGSGSVESTTAIGGLGAVPGSN